MTDESKHLPWNEGLATKPDVDALMKAFPPEKIEAGVFRVTDEEVRAVIGRATGSRYRTVYAAWIKRLKRDHRVLLYREQMKGFFCPTPEQVFSMTHPTYEHVGRSINKQLTSVGIVKPENDQQRTVQEHQGRLLHATKRELRKDRMNLLPDTSIDQAPRIEPPKKASK